MKYSPVCRLFCNSHDVFKGERDSKKQMLLLSLNHAFIKSSQDNMLFLSVKNILISFYINSLLQSRIINPSNYHTE